MGVLNLKLGKECDDIELMFTSFVIKSIIADNSNGIVQAILLTCNGCEPIRFLNCLSQPTPSNLFTYAGVLLNEYNFSVPRSIQQQIVVVCYDVEFFDSATKEQMDEWRKKTTVVVNYDFHPLNV